MESKINNTKQMILYFDTFSWNVCKIKQIHAVSCKALKTIILKRKESKSNHGCKYTHKLQ